MSISGGGPQLPPSQKKGPKSTQNTTKGKSAEHKPTTTGTSGSTGAGSAGQSTGAKPTEQTLADWHQGPREEVGSDNKRELSWQYYPVPGLHIGNSRELLRPRKGVAAASPTPAPAPVPPPPPPAPVNTDPVYVEDVPNQNQTKGQKPNTKGKPEPTDSPDAKGKPDTVGKSGTKGKPDTVGKSTTKDKPDSTGKPTGVGKPDTSTPAGGTVQTELYP